MVSAGRINARKKRVTERLIRIGPPNHELIRGVKRESARDSNSLAGRPSFLVPPLPSARSRACYGTSPSRRCAPKGRQVTTKAHHRSRQADYRLVGWRYVDAG